MKCAPILLVCHDRFDHVQATLAALQKNDYAPQSDLYIFQDGQGPRTHEIRHKSVRSFIHGVSGFKNLHVNTRNSNIGLAENITQAISEVLNLHESVIVLEDDIVTSHSFLRFMNESLMRYQEIDRVMHINAYVYPYPSISRSETLTTYFSRLPISWGWATYRRSWLYYKKDVAELLQSFDSKAIYDFNFGGSHTFWQQVLDNQKGNINSWAIFWYAAIFRRKGLCLTPAQSLVQNIGFDGSGVHCDATKTFSHDHLYDRTTFVFEDKLVEDKVLYKNLRTYFKTLRPSIKERMKGMLKIISSP